MAIRKQRLMRVLDDGTMDTIWLETSADVVKYVNSDGSTSNITEVVNNTKELIRETEKTIQETRVELGTVKETVKEIVVIVKPPEVPDEPIDPGPTDPGKEPGGDNIDDPPNNDGTLDGYKPGEIVTMVPSVGEGLTGPCNNYFYFVFERSDFEKDGKTLRIPQKYHKMDPKHTAVNCVIRARIGRTAVDYYRDTALSVIRDKLIACQRAGLDRYQAGEHSEFPMDEDGNVILTWEQVQVWMLEDAMKTRSQARDYCLSKNINWKNIATLDVTTDVTIEDIMSACYIPAATPGASTSKIDKILSYDVVNALHLRQRDEGVPIQAKYDLFGKMTNQTWFANDAQVYWDLRTKDLVIETTGKYPGDILVIG